MVYIFLVGLIVKIDNTGNFNELIESISNYVDKAYMIEELLQSKRYVTIFLRPNKYGKKFIYINVRYFFYIEYKDINKNLFENLKKIIKKKFWERDICKIN